MGWAGQIYPYVKSLGVFDCPDDPTNPTTYTLNGNTYTKVPISYAYNLDPPNSYSMLWYSGGYNDGIYAKSGTLSGLNSPPRTVLFAECQGAVSDPTNGYESDSPTTSGDYLMPETTASPNMIKLATGYMGGRGDYMSSQQGNTTTGNYLAPTGIHTGGSNFCMCDGHVKWLTGGVISSGARQQADVIPNPPVCGPLAPQDNFGNNNFGGHAAGTENPSWVATFSPV